jgi:hypothetical protein
MEDSLWVIGAYVFGLISASVIWWIILRQYKVMVDNYDLHANRLIEMVGNSQALKDAYHDSRLERQQFGPEFSSDPD